MKKTLFILTLLTLCLLYYLGVLTPRETLPFSKEFFSVETSSLEGQLLSPGGRGGSRGKEGAQEVLSLGSKELDQLYQLKLDKGILNVPLLSFLLIRQTRQHLSAGDSGRAVESANYAVRFSPDLPEPYFELSRALWHQNPLQIRNILSELWKGEGARFRYYPSALGFFYNVFYILGNALLMTFIVFGIVILVKYLPLYFYDIRRNLNQEVSKLLTNSLKIFLLFAPFFLRLDILWAVLFYCILLWGFATSRERQLIILSLILLVYVPFFLRSSSAFLDGKASDVLLDMNEAYYETWNRATDQRLKDWLSTHPDDSQVVFTLGLMGKKEGRYDQAEEYYKKAVQISPHFSEAFCNLGNVYFARKQTDLAISSYKQAVELGPQTGAYYYNLYRAYSQETYLSDKKDEAFQRAMQLNPRLVEYYTSIDSVPNMNRLVVDVVLPPSTLWERFVNQWIGREGVLFRLFRAWFEKVPSRVPFLIPLFFLGFVVGISKYVRTKRYLTPCPLCGSPTHRFYLGNTDEEYICFNCYRIYIQKERLHPKIAEKKTFQVERFQKQNHFLGKFLSFFFIGFQDLWGDRPLKGLALLFVFFAFVLRFVYWDGVIPPPAGRSPWWIANLIFWVALFGLYYVLAIRQVLRVKPRFEEKKGGTRGPS